MIIDECTIKAMSSEDKIRFYNRTGSNSIESDVQFGAETVLLGKSIRIDSKCKIGANSKMVFQEIHLGRNVEIGNNVDIRSKKIIIGENVQIGNDVTFLCPEEVFIGNNSNFGNDNNVTCRSFVTGDFTQFYSNIIVGGGGKYSINSKMKIGKYCYIGDCCVLNTSEEISIGNNVGIGRECLIWTHGSWGSPLDGFPSSFSSVMIGDNVWIPARTTILPGITIGSNVVIGTNSLVNQNVPSGCFAAGIPIKVIKENVYPKKLDGHQKKKIINSILSKYRILMQDKKLSAKVSFDEKKNAIILTNSESTTVFDLSTMQVDGKINPESEDLRDFLRRNGVKFFTDTKFKSIIPQAFMDFIEYQKNPLFQIRC